MPKDIEAERIEQVVVRNLIALREERGWSQTEVARRMTDLGWPKYTQMTVSRTEKGERPIRLDEANSLADVFGVDMDVLWMPKVERVYLHHLAKAERSEEELTLAIREYLEHQQALAVLADELRIDTTGQESVVDILVRTPEAIAQQIRSERWGRDVRVTAEQESAATEAFWSAEPGDRQLVRFFGAVQGGLYGDDDARTIPFGPDDLG